MKAVADIGKKTLALGDTKFGISCDVRTLKGGTRGRAVKEVRRCISDNPSDNNLPYDPRPFPRGLWEIISVEWRGKPHNFDPWEYGTVKIRTNAWQMLNVWELDIDGNYLRETDRLVKDTGYLLHYSDSKTTLGCIRLDSVKEAETLGKLLEERIARNGPVPFEVI